MVILFPSDYFDKKKPDEMFSDQVRAFESLNFKISTVSLEDLQLSKVRFYPALPENEEVLYRGWMVSPGEYEQLAGAVLEAKAKPFTTPEQYSLTHHIPNWYPRIAELTPETVCFADLETIEQGLKALNWQGFFVKDYVKSLKTSIGSRIDSPEQIQTVLSEMGKFRGQIEGGVCVRRLEAIDETSERRYFVVRGEVYSSGGEAPPPIVKECVSRLDSPFFSVDIAMRDDGELRVIEVGDGQVSDLVGWSVEKFATLWQ